MERNVHNLPLYTSSFTAGPLTFQVPKSSQGAWESWGQLGKPGSGKCGGRAVCSGIGNGIGGGRDQTDM